MNDKYGKGVFISIGIVLLGLLVFTFFNFERVVPYDEAVQYFTLTEKDGKILLSQNVTKGTTYTYNDNYFEGTEKGDNIYVVFKMSLIDRWLLRETKGFGGISINKVNNKTPEIWYIEDTANPNNVKISLNDKITQGE